MELTWPGRMPPKAEFRTHLLGSHAKAMKYWIRGIFYSACLHYVICVQVPTKSKSEHQVHGAGVAGSRKPPIVWMLGTKLQSFKRAVWWFEYAWPREWHY